LHLVGQLLNLIHDAETHVYKMPYCVCCHILFRGAAPTCVWFCHIILFGWGIW